MRAKEYPLLVQCVEGGVRWGWQHAHKHVEDPDTEAILERIIDDVIHEICEHFEFDDEVERL